MYGSTVVPGVTETSTVPELMNNLRCFQDNRFAQVETILTHRENVVKTSLEELRKQNHMLKEERDLMVKKHALAELEKLKFEDDMRMSKKNCDELKEMLVRLNADHQLLSGCKKELEERYQKLVKEIVYVKEENSRITIEFNEKIEEKNQIIVELNEKIELLKEEKNQTVLECNEKMEVLKEEKNQIVIELNEEIEVFKQEMEGKIEVYKQNCEKLMKFKKEMGKIMHADSVHNSRGTGSFYFQKKGPQPIIDLDYDNGMPTGQQLTSEAGGTGKLIHPPKEITGQLGSDPIIIDLSVGDDDVPTGLPTRIGEKGVWFQRNQ